MRIIKYTDIVKSFAKEGYDVLTSKDEYIKQIHSDKIKFRCPNNHEYSYSIGKWNIGFRCPYCSKSFTWFGDIRKEFEKENLIVLTKEEEFKSLKETKIKFRCMNGHIHQMKYIQFKRGTRCPYCKGSKTYYNDILECFEKEGYRILSKKYKAGQSIKFICPKDHVHKIRWDSWKSGARCYYCAKLGRSKAEMEICNFLDNLNIDYIPNDRTVIKNPKTERGLELDIWFPSLNKAIEFNGEYWHSLKSRFERDILKKKLCLDKNINLLVILYKEWINNKENILEKIKEFVEFV